MTPANTPPRRPVLLRAHRWLAALVLVAGILGAKALGDHFVEVDEAQQAAAFDELAQRVGSDLETDLLQKLTALGGVGDAAAVSGLDRTAELVALAERVRRRVPSVAALSIARAVDDVAAYEARPDAITVKPTREGPAVVLEVLVPLEGNEGAVGFDLLSERHRAAATLAARDSGEPVASAPVQPVPIRMGAGLAAVLFLPVYEGQAIPITLSQRQTRFLGGISALISPEHMLPEVVTRDIRVEVWDVGSADGTRSIPVHMASSDRRVVSGQDVTGPRRIVEQDVAGRRWQIVVDGIGLEEDASTWLATGVPVGGSVVAFLLSVLVLVGGGSLERSHRDRELLALREAERQAIVGAFGDGYLRLDHDLVVLTSTGGPWQDIVGRRIGLVDPAVGPALTEVATRALQRQDVQSIDLELPRADPAGSEGVERQDGDVDREGAVTIEVRVTPVGDGLAVSLRDVSSRASMERELRKAHDGIQSLATALEHRVAERTRELAGVTAHLERTNDELESFVYTAAHELRTPLTMMIGSLAWFDEYLDVSGIEKDLLLRSRGAATRMRERIDRLVDEAHAVAIGDRAAVPAASPAPGTAAPASPTDASSGASTEAFDSV